MTVHCCGPSATAGSIGRIRLLEKRDSLSVQRTSLSTDNLCGFRREPPHDELLLTRVSFSRIKNGDESVPAFDDSFTRYVR